jgi:hypothetical protein
MPSEAPGAVLRIEARISGRSKNVPPEVVERALGDARRLLETPAPGRTFSAQQVGHGGTLVVHAAAEAFAVLHALRTELRRDPSLPAIVLVAGIGAGDRAEGGRLAGESLRTVAHKRNRLTHALTRDAHANKVLSALCRTIDSLIAGWTEAQWQAIHRRDGGRTLQQIGEELGIAYQNVSKRLLAAQYPLYREVLEVCGLVLARAADNRG